MKKNNPLVTEQDLAFFYALSLDDQQYYCDQVSLWDLKPNENIDEKAAKIAVKASQNLNFR